MAAYENYEAYLYFLTLLFQAISALLAISACKNSGRYRYPWMLMSAVMMAVLIRQLGSAKSSPLSSDLLSLEVTFNMLIWFGMMVSIFTLKNIFLKLENQKIDLEALVKTDTLTGALNRAGIMFHLEQEFKRAHRTLKPVAILMIDIDHFKRVNDEYGHLTGDVVLQNLISHLHRSVREIDSIGRFGGEEFLVILPDTSTEQASVTAERFRKTIEQSTCAYANEEVIKITISIGISVYNPREYDPQKSQNRLQEYIRQSDLAMYKAKNSGRNCVVLWTPELGPIQTL